MLTSYSKSFISTLGQTKYIFCTVWQSVVIWPSLIQKLFMKTYFRVGGKFQKKRIFQMTSVKAFHRLNQNIMKLIQLTQANLTQTVSYTQSEKGLLF